MILNIYRINSIKSVPYKVSMSLAWIIFIESSTKTFPYPAIIFTVEIALAIYDITFSLNKIALSTNTISISFNIILLSTDGILVSMNNIFMSIDAIVVSINNITSTISYITFSIQDNISWTIEKVLRIQWAIASPEKT